MFAPAHCPTKNGKVQVVRVMSQLAEADGQAPMHPTLITDEATQQILRNWNGLAHADATGPGSNTRQ